MFRKHFVNHKMKTNFRKEDCAEKRKSICHTNEIKTGEWRFKKTFNQL